MTRTEFENKLTEICDAIIGSDSPYHWENHFEDGQYQFKLVRGEMTHAFTVALDKLEPDEEVSVKNLKRVSVAYNDATAATLAKLPEFDPDVFLAATPEQRQKMRFDREVKSSIAYLGMELSFLKFDAMEAAH